MANWAPEGFAGKNAGRISSLRQAVSTLTPKAKQAMYAAAKRGPIAQRTWNGCAFNAGASEVGVNGVSDFYVAAKVFDMKSTDVQEWIHFWDGYTAPDPTADLVNVLDSVGLFSDPVGRGFAGKTFVTVVHESEQTKFDKMVADLDLDEAVSEEDAQFKTGVSAAADLIFA